MHFPGLQKFLLQKQYDTSIHLSIWLASSSHDGSQQQHSHHEDNEHFSSATSEPKSQLVIGINTENGVKQEIENITVDQEEELPLGKVNSKEELPCSGPLGTATGIHVCVTHSYAMQIKPQ